jgi:hypothetical protein
VRIASRTPLDGARSGHDVAAYGLTFERSDYLLAHARDAPVAPNLFDLQALSPDLLVPAQRRQHLGDRNQMEGPEFPRRVQDCEITVLWKLANGIK